MDRRDFFLKTAQASGVVLPWWGLLPVAQAQANQGKILFDIHADGGIDQSSWTDPRETDGTINNYAAAGTPAAGPGIGGCTLKMAPMGANAAFLAAHFQQMLVVNGVNTETNSHEDGDRASATGKLEMGHATVAELFASQYGAGLPYAWLDAGSFNMSAGLVPPTAFPNSNQLRASVLPNSQSATNDYLKQGDLDKVFAARQARTQNVKASANAIPRSSRLSDQFLAAPDARARLKRVAEFIPATFDAGFEQAQIGLIAAQAGIGAVVKLRTGGFDGHGDLANSYNGANGSLTRLTNLMQYVWAKSATLGISDRIVMLVRSEFGRTTLNGGNGKDHYNNGGTMVVMFPPGTSLGNRVVGATGVRHQSVRVNPTTGALDPNGIVLTPRHVHQALREHLGIQTTNPAFQLGVPANEKIALFNPSMRTGYPNA